MNEETEVTSPPLKKPKVDNENITPEIKTKKEEVDHDMEVNEDKVDPEINSFVNSDDIQKLREFKVLDEVKSNEEDSNAEDSDSSDDNSEGLPEEEIEKMLEEDLPEGFKAGPTKPKARPYVTRTKTVLEEKGVNQFEVLPIDWMTVRHQSGMPVYLHKGTRVCTLSKPYFIGKGNIKRHDIPISAIPCLAYKRALEEDEKQKEMDRKLEEQIKNLSQKVTKQNIGNKPEGNEKKGQLLFPGKTSGAGDNYKNRCPFKHLREKTENSDKMKDENDLMETDTDKENTREIKGGTTSTSTGLNDNDTGGQFKRPAELDFTDDLIVHNETKSENTTITSVNATESSDEKEINTEGINEAGSSATKDEVSAGGSGEKSDNKANISDVLSDMQIPINRRPVVLPSGEIIPAPRVESVNNSWKTQCLTPEQFNDYCKKLFKFKSVNVLQFNRWADRRKYAKAKKTMQFPKLPEGTKLITIPVNSGQDGNGGKGAKRDWVMNMNGGSYLSVFHEYVCRALQKQPVYEYKQLENAQTLYKTFFVQILGTVKCCLQKCAYPRITLCHKGLYYCNSLAENSQISHQGLTSCRKRSNTVPSSVIKSFNFLHRTLKPRTKLCHKEL
ncbi:uncharacterized protein LOC112056282 isoform X2 [Bicyclus anynana]|uniref:Uncharacterized protein LOC112056282 isoform X2 n=1 Tax=Bicyclus anynana TaxID=110368 RepID=A0ABM3LJI3_BICAN|nr:uncharacterized protein LOC112056282 isoform X2 [Bicyclus anynana]